MQQHFTYDELTPLEQCIVSFATGRHWGRENLPTYADDMAAKKDKNTKPVKVN